MPWPTTNSAVSGAAQPRRSEGCFERTVEPVEFYPDTPRIPWKPRFPRCPLPPVRTTLDWKNGSVRRYPFWIVLAIMVITSGTSSEVGLQSSSSAASTRANVALSHCAPKQLSISLGQNLAGAGNRALVLLFQNSSSSICRLGGYPVVVGLDSRGRRVGTASHTPANDALSAPVHSVSLRPDQTGSSLLQTVGIQHNGATCFTYRSLLVRAPDTKRFFRIPLKWPVGEGPATNGLSVCGTVFVDPVVAGVKKLF
jgi:Protein of unknown function (DUF4232)